VGGGTARGAGVCRADDAAGEGAPTGADGAAAEAAARSVDLVDQFAQGVLHVAGGPRGLALCGLLLAHQGQQRVGTLERVEVEHQPVPVGGHGGQRELLRQHRLLEVEHQAHDPRLVLADAHAGDVGVVGPHLADELAQGRVELEAVEVHHQTRRRVGHLVRGDQRLRTRA
jgi:hypothetical protein